jgi:hypothetical protein
MKTQTLVSIGIGLLLSNHFASKTTANDSVIPSSDKSHSENSVSIDNVIFLVDCSHWAHERIKVGDENRFKIDETREKIRSAITVLPMKVPIEIRVFGSGVNGDDLPSDCRRTEIIAPFQCDRKELLTQVGNLHAANGNCNPTTSYAAPKSNPCLAVSTRSGVMSGRQFNF